MLTILLIICWAFIGFVNGDCSSGVLCNVCYEGETCWWKVNMSDTSTSAETGYECVITDGEGVCTPLCSKLCDDLIVTVDRPQTFLEYMRTKLREKDHSDQWMTRLLNGQIRKSETKATKQEASKDIIKSLKDNNLSVTVMDITDDSGITLGKRKYYAPRLAKATKDAKKADRIELKSRNDVITVVLSKDFADAKNFESLDVYGAAFDIETTDGNTPTITISEMTGRRLRRLDGKTIDDCFNVDASDICHENDDNEWICDLEDIDVQSGCTLETVNTEDVVAPCPDGQTNIGVNNPTCTHCEAGHGGATCDACGVATYNSGVTPIDVVCATMSCPLGQGTVQVGSHFESNTCEVCGGGYSPSADDGECIGFVAHQECKTESNGGCSAVQCVDGYHEDNGACVINVCQCTNGVADTECSTHGATECSSCDAGYHGDQCDLNQCNCANGVDATGDSCPTHGSIKCVSCDVGFDGDQCDANECTCTGGTAASGEQCTTHDEEKCVSCGLGYGALGSVCEECTGLFYSNENSNAACNAHAGCSDEEKYLWTSGHEEPQCIACNSNEVSVGLYNKNCTIIECLCENGEPATGPNCPDTTQHKCQSCSPGYSMTGAQTCENIDECAENTHDCDQYATCFDTDGSFTCECNVGYTDLVGQNGKLCTECTMIDYQNNQCCTSPLHSHYCIQCSRCPAT